MPSTVFPTAKQGVAAVASLPSITQETTTMSSESKHLGFSFVMLIVVAAIIYGAYAYFQHLGA